jgi:3-phenylpropionate/trans-cinnamate dioxygenase ferredoxin subunit
MSDFIDAFDESALEDGQMTMVEIDGHQLVVARANGEFYIADGRCPHLHAKLWNGTLEGTVLECPLHHSQFDLVDGRAVRWTNWSGTVLTVSELVRHPRPLRTYEVKVEDGVVKMGGQKEPPSV